MSPVPNGPVVRAVTPGGARPGTNGVTNGATSGPGPWTSPPVALTRSPRGWAVVSPHGVDAVYELVEGMTLADLVAEEFGASLEPDRASRRSARGPAATTDGTAADPRDDGAAAGGAPGEHAVDARIAALERTVAQLEHALAARVSTERAIGVLAERHGTAPRAAFETLRRDARSQGRPVHELAREVLAELPGDELPGGEQRPAADQARPLTAVASITPSAPRPAAHRARVDVAVADGRP